MYYSNLHTHTTFSDGAHTMEQNIRAAMDSNMVSLGFSDHSYTPCDLTYCMRPEQYEGYVAKFHKLRHKYSLPLYLGLELDADSDDDLSPYDYIIASAHYINRGGNCYPIDHSRLQQQVCIRDAFGGSVLDMVRCYFDILGEHVAKVKPTLVGHFDVITKYSIMPEEDDAYRAIAADALKHILKLCPYIEMNTGAIAKGWRTTPYPGAYLLETVRDNGGHIVLSSDAHRSENLTFRFDGCLELLRAAGIDHIAVFRGDGFDRQPI